MFPRRVVGSWPPKWEVCLLSSLPSLSVENHSRSFLLLKNVLAGYFSIRHCSGVHAHASVTLMRRIESWRTNQVGEINTTPRWYCVSKPSFFFFCNNRSGNLSVSIGAEAAREISVLPAARVIVSFVKIPRGGRRAVEGGTPVRNASQAERARHLLHTRMRAIVVGLLFLAILPCCFHDPCPTPESVRRSPHSTLNNCDGGCVQQV